MSGGPRQRIKCFRCLEEKPRERFPVGRSGTKRSTVCWACTEEEAYAREAVKAKRRATWIDPATGRVVRRCAVCREVKDLEHGFYKSPKPCPGSKYPANVPCRKCKDELNRAYFKRSPETERASKEIHRRAAKRYIEKHPDRIKQRNKRYWAKLKADPERHTKALENQRINARLRAEREGKPMKRSISTAKRGEERCDYIPSAPLAALVGRMIEQRELVEGLIDDGSRGAQTAVCKDLGIDTRTFRRWRNGEATKVRFTVAERVIENADVEWSSVYSYDDYPEVYRERERVS